MKTRETGDIVALFRAAGMLYPKEKRFFNDPYAEMILSFGGKESILSIAYLLTEVRNKELLEELNALVTKYHKKISPLIKK